MFPASGDKAGGSAGCLPEQGVSVFYTQRSARLKTSKTAGWAYFLW